MNNYEPQLELALQEALRYNLDPLVRQANQDAALLEDSKMDKNQIRNVLNVADESQSLAVVTNFIRYQMGRRDTKDAWQHRRRGIRFGEQVIKQIEDPKGIVAQQAKAVLQRVRAMLKQAGKRTEEISITQEVIDELHYDLMRYYLGYLNRAFIYGKETGKWQDLRATGEEA